MEQLLTFVVYDIPDDRTRMRIMNTCRDYGLAHTQYSVFSGPLDATRRNELFARLSDTLGSEAGHIIVVPVCEKDAKARRTVQRTG
ncbi:MAG: CRISPR-associated endonuclease Cas2 [bacterium]|nr:CRISPR-associated endonuclease Cas2 [bacterium]